MHFTVPTETTDHLPLTRKGIPMQMSAIVCRLQGAQCLPTTRVAVTPGQTAAATDTLPPALTLGRDRPVMYRVRIENALGRDAGSSRDAVAVAGEAPGPVTGLAVTTGASGMQLTWQAAPPGSGAVRVEAITEAPGTQAPPAFGQAPVRAAPVARLLQVPPSRKDPGGAVDPAPAVGSRISYRVYRQREVNVAGATLQIRGETATVTVVRSADLFPPAAPQGLLAVSFQAGDGSGAVSLSWDPNPEPDVVGYQVYRAIGSGEMTRVTPAPVSGVTYQDSAAGGVTPGMHARYAVTAVDRNGNESPRSAPTEVDVR